MNDQRIAIWRGLFGKTWWVALYRRRPTEETWAGEFVEHIYEAETHAEAIHAARDWIKANPLAIDPKAAA